MDYDEIYRKEDGNCRVLLSFQNDGMTNAVHSEPAVAAGPCLSFGLHLAGRDYKELDMPRWQAITRITEGQTRIFNSRTGLAAE